ncbi:MAG: VWA domain-containing protein [Alphaproteobacteria bacterium]|nr:VWA domain-containing protein [Alphaproteobacteria bacterium]
MDDRKLEELLSNLTAPEPSKDAQDQALQRAMAAFDEKISKTAQGKTNAPRLTGISNILSHIRSKIMKKRFIVSGTVGAVATCAIVAVLGTSFYHQQVADIIGPEREHQAQPTEGNADLTKASMNVVQAAPGFCLFGCKKDKPPKDAGALKLGNSSTLFATGGDQVKVTRGTVDNVDADMRERLTRANEAEYQNPRSFIPLAIESAKGDIAIPSPQDVGVDPLAQWRQAGQERARLEMGRKPADKKSSPEGVAVGGAAMLADTAQNVVQSAPRAKEEAKSRRDSMMQERAAPTAPAASVPGVAFMPAEVDMIAPMPAPDDRIVHQYQEQGRDQFQAFEENSIKNVKADPVSTFSIDVDTASYSFVRRALNNGVLPQKNAIRIEEMINYFDYDYAVPEQGGHPFQPTVAVYDSPWRSGNKLIHIGVKGYQVQEKPKSNLVFLIDTSGSMYSADKLPLLISSFKMLLDTLSPDDTIGIVTYAGSSGVALQPTKVSDKHKILAVLDGLRSSGSTAGAEGIRQAYQLAEQSFVKEGNNRIILATDGDFNVGISNRDELKGFVERKRKSGIFLSILGFGQGNYNDHLMQALAQNGNGTAAYIDTLNEARKVLVDEGSSMLFTIAKDVKLQVEFNPQTVQEYRLVGYETRALNREDFNNDKVDAGDIGAGHTVTAIYEITPVGATPIVDDLRYQKPAPKVIDGHPVVAPAQDDAAEAASGDEYAFLKIRYKKPDSDTSTLMTRAITKADEKDFDALSDDIRFASAVASFAQMLKGSKFVAADYDTVIEVANQARGKDEFGYRTEFVNLVRLAKTAAGLQPLR